MSLESPPFLISSFALLLLGGLVCFCGYRLFKLVLALVGFAAGALAAGGFALLLTSGSALIVWSAAIVGGVVGALILVFTYYVGVFVVGACSGFVLGSVIGTGLSGTLAAIVVVASSLIAGILALKLERVMLALSTAIIGSTLMTAGGMGAVIGREASWALGQRLWAGEAPGQSGWVALIALTLLATVGAGLQLSGKSRKRE